MTNNLINKLFEGILWYLQSQSQGLAGHLDYHSIPWVWNKLLYPTNVKALSTRSLALEKLQGCRRKVLVSSSPALGTLRSWHSSGAVVCGLHTAPGVCAFLDDSWAEVIPRPGLLWLPPSHVTRPICMRAPALESQKACEKSYVLISPRNKCMLPNIIRSRFFLRRFQNPGA